MHISRNIIRRVSRPLAHGLLAGVTILVIASCGLFYLWSSAREADAQAGSVEHLSLLAPTQEIRALEAGRGRVPIVALRLTR
jgi:hypothetical protein